MGQLPFGQPQIRLVTSKQESIPREWNERSIAKKAGAFVMGIHIISGCGRTNRQKLARHFGREPLQTRLIRIGLGRPGE
jgi:hypothetical protein